MRWLVGVALFLGVVVVGFWHDAPVASACSCAVLTPEESVASVELVARVKVIGASHAADGAIGTYRAQMIDVWKGEPEPFVDFQSELQDATCGLGELHEGDEMLLYASRDATGTYSAGLCSIPHFDAQTDAAGALTAILGEPTPVPTPSATAAPTSGSPEPVTRPQIPTPPTGAVLKLTAAVVLGIGLLVVGLRILRRR